VVEAGEPGGVNCGPEIVADNEIGIRFRAAVRAWRSAVAGIAATSNFIAIFCASGPWVAGLACCCVLVFMAGSSDVRQKYAVGGSPVLVWINGRKGGRTCVRVNSSQDRHMAS
jgi:hypothetical protein